MSLSRLLLAYVAAMVLLLVTIGISISPLPWRPVWMFACATLEAALVLGCFIELQRSSPLVKVFALGTVFFFVVLFGMTLMDLFHRMTGGIGA
jgi:caa(3)-type oxidase subunit IV